MTTNPPKLIAYARGKRGLAKGQWVVVIYWPEQRDAAERALAGMLAKIQDEGREAK